MTAINACQKKAKGWKKYAAIAGEYAGCSELVQVFKVAKTGYKTYKAVKYSKKARAAYKGNEGDEEGQGQAKPTVVAKKQVKSRG